VLQVVPWLQHGDHGSLFFVQLQVMPSWLPLQLNHSLIEVVVAAGLQGQGNKNKLMRTTE